MSKQTIPTIIAVLVLIIGLAVGVVLVQTRQVFKLRASPDTTPQDVRITNITDQSFTASWTTSKETAGYITWGTTENTSNTAPADSDQATYVHSIIVNGLSPNTSYYFKIVSNNTTYDNNGLPWQTQTGPRLDSAGPNQTLSGSVLTPGGQPAVGVLVQVSGSNLAPVSTKTSSNGNWVIPLSRARTPNLNSPANLGNNPLLEIFVQGGTAGVASAQIYANTAQSTPPIILGQTHDFRNEGKTDGTDTPESQIELPEETEQESGFNVSEETSTSSAETVTLESVETGEVITTTEPEFFGEGPVGTEITITIESEIQTDTLTIGSSGEWSWSPPEGLEEGTHTITLKWTDASGILRTLTRTFIVQASEGPAFESTPSASPTSSPSASPSPTASASASPSATPRKSIPSTEAGVPESGVLTPTIVLSIMGIGLIVGSFVAWKFSENA